MVRGEEYTMPSFKLRIPLLSSILFIGRFKLHVNGLGADMMLLAHRLGPGYGDEQCQDVSPQSRGNGRGPLATDTAATRQNGAKGGAGRYRTMLRTNVIGRE